MFTSISLEAILAEVSTSLVWLPTLRIFSLWMIGLIGCKINYFKELALLTSATLA